MTNPRQPLEVGSPDPEMRNSPILEDLDEEFEVLAQEVEEMPRCYFNGVAYPHGQFVRSGAEVLRCEHGTWVREGPGDPENP